MTRRGPSSLEATDPIKPRKWPPLQIGYYDVNAVSDAPRNLGLTALHVAAHGHAPGAVNRISVLLKHGAKVDARRVLGRTCRRAMATH